MMYDYDMMITTQRTITIMMIKYGSGHHYHQHRGHCRHHDLLGGQDL